MTTDETTDDTTGGAAPDPAADKVAARRWARGVAPTTSDESDAVVAHLAGLDLLAAARTACLFLPMAGEVDLQSLPGLLPHVSWTTTRTGDGPLLSVHDLDAPRERHVLGYEQPVATAPARDPADVDVWLVPGLAFDHRGTRLGHGVGYYDRVLARRHPDATLVGTTVARRITADLPRADHDVAMTVLATEDGLRRVG